MDGRSTTTKGPATIGSDTEGEPPADGHWDVRRSPHFDLATPAGTTAPRRAVRMLARREAALRGVLRRYRIRSPRLPRIAWFVYETPRHKADVTGDALPAHAELGRARIHQLRDHESAICLRHEIAHLVLAPLGRPGPILLEGAAEFAAHGATACLRCAVLRSAGTSPTAVDLLDDADFAAADARIAYPAAGALVQLLVELAGPERFLSLYGRPSPVAEAIRAEYGLTPADLERMWRDRVSPAAALAALAAAGRSGPRRRTEASS